ncbi:centrosomal protein of 126 kDa [Salarias fasciatus]|uniref:centrosomal protein of 126 kDa n=1 Tax=Salarias fasciatus TaxID=181472 RepID=UPI0011766234|nr:centrosomal protein of 126 kDa [Salarias fasciatus]
MDNFFYHSNPRLGSDGGLDTERQLLTEEQKMCKTRARKFSLETNRRRKALDERRRQWDMQEQQLREHILQQRRQQVQDVTERFQRAHLPSSQRRRQSMRRNVINLDDALNHIRCTSSIHSRQNSFTNNSNISSCTPSPKPPTVSKSSLHQALSAVEAYTQLQQDQSRAEKQQDHSPQGSHVSECCNSESLSSKDSLDNEDLEPSTKNPQSSFSSFFIGSEKTHPDLREQSDLCPPADLTPFSGMLLLADNLAPSRKQFEPKPKKQEDSDWPHEKMHIPKPSWEYTSVQKTAKADTRPALHNCNILAVCELMSDDSEDFKTNSPQSSSREHIITTGDTSGNATNLESACPEQETLLDIKEQKNHDVKLLKYPSATEIPSPAKNGNGKDVFFGSTSKPNIFLNDSTTDNLVKEETPQQTAEDSHYLSSQREPSASINNLNKGLNTHHKHEKSFNAASLQHACSSNIQSGTHKCQEYLDEEVRKLPVSEAASRPACEVRFIKGILKKQSKYMSGNPTHACGAGHLIFAKQVALAIRDSVELTRAKAKDTEGNKTVKKKLRWFDEMHVEKEAKEQNMMKHARGKSSNPPQCKNSPEDHQLSLAAGAGTPKAGPRVTPAASARSHFTKEAWADVGVQTGPPQERSDEVKVPRCNTRTGGPRVPRRERSARATAGLVSSRTRKGTVMRPQSATEVSQIAKAQGRAMAPRPPPRMDSVAVKTAYVSKTPYGLDLSGFHCKQAPAAEQTLHRSSSDVFLSLSTHHAIPADCSVTYAPLPPSYIPPFSEGSSKSASGPGHQETHNCGRRRGMAVSEKGLCLDCTPTEDEISQLWHDVRSALTTKDAKTAQRRQAPENGRVSRKPCVQPPGSGNRRPLPTSQPSKQTTQLARPFSVSSCATFPNRGSESTTQFHLAEAHAQGLLEEERDAAAAMETAAQTQKPGQQQGLTNISLEEQKILLSLERLNHQLHCAQEYVGVNSGSRGPVLIGETFVRDMKVSLYKRCASSASSRSRFQKKS